MQVKKQQLKPEIEQHWFQIGKGELQGCILSPAYLTYMQSQFSSVAHHVQLFVTPWTAACQASLLNNSWSLLKLMSINSVIPSNHLILCLPLLLLSSIFPSIRVFSNESVLRITCPKYWSFSLTISPSNESAKSLQSCPTLCDPIDGSPPGSSAPGILQARTLEWVAISFSNA